jgi:hypothetical protein
MIWKIRDKEDEKIMVAAQVKRPIGWCVWSKYFGVFGSNILK